MTPLTQPNWRFLEIVINENDGTFGLRAFRWPHKLASGLTWDGAVKQGEEFERKLAIGHANVTPRPSQLTNASLPSDVSGFARPLGLHP